MPTIQVPGVGPMNVPVGGAVTTADGKVMVVRPDGSLAPAGAQTQREVTSAWNAVRSGPAQPTTAGGAGGGSAGGNADLVAASESLLRQLGLDELAPLVSQWIGQGLYTSWAQIEARLLDRSTDAGRIVDRIYPELRLSQEENARRRAAGMPDMPPLSIAGIQQYYSQGEQMISQRGLTAAFPDLRKAMQGWLVQGKSLAEQAARLDVIEDDVADAISGSPEALADMEAWSRFYGVGPTLQAYVAHVINPTTDLPTLVKQQAAVGLDRAAGRAGFGDLERSEAEQIARWGVGEQDAVAGFGDLAALGEVVNPLAGSAEDVIGRDVQIDAVFGGNKFARKRIEKRLAERRGAFQGGGGFAQDRDGGYGLGVAR